MVYFVALDELYQTVYFYWQHRFSTNEENRNRKSTECASCVTKDTSSRASHETPERKES
jgi:hypothetical protein